MAILHIDLKNPSKTILRGRTWAKTFPQGGWNMGPKSHFTSSEKATNTTQGPILFHFINQARGMRKSIWCRRPYVSHRPCRKVLSVCLHLYICTKPIATTQQKSTTYLNGWNCLCLLRTIFCIYLKKALLLSCLKKILKHNSRGSFVKNKSWKQFALLPN